jgi:hypothetical protein
MQIILLNLQERESKIRFSFTHLLSCPFVPLYSLHPFYRLIHLFHFLFSFSFFYHYSYVSDGVGQVRVTGKSVAIEAPDDRTTRFPTSENIEQRCLACSCRLHAGENG